MVDSGSSAQKMRLYCIRLKLIVAQNMKKTNGLQKIRLDAAQLVVIKQGVPNFHKIPKENIPPRA